MTDFQATFSNIAKGIVLVGMRTRLSLSFRMAGIEPNRGLQTILGLTDKIEAFSNTMRAERSDVASVFGMGVYITAQQVNPQNWEQYLSFIGMIRRTVAPALEPEFDDEVEKKSLTRILDACDEVLGAAEKIDPKLLKIMDFITQSDAVTQHIQCLYPPEMVVVDTSQGISAAMFTKREPDEP